MPFLFKKHSDVILTRHIIQIGARFLFRKKLVAVLEQLLFTMNRRSAPIAHSCRCHFAVDGDVMRRKYSMFSTVCASFIRKPIQYTQVGVYLLDVILLILIWGEHTSTGAITFWTLCTSFWFRWSYNFRVIPSVKPNSGAHSNLWLIYCRFYFDMARRAH